jgi:hypothetical protein
MGSHSFQMISISCLFSLEEWRFYSGPCACMLSHTPRPHFKNCVHGIKFPIKFWVFPLKHK